MAATYVASETPKSADTTNRLDAAFNRVENPDESPSKDKPAPEGQLVSMGELFSYADRTDKLLMFLGTIGALAAGISQPIQIVLFGDVLNTFNPADPGADIETGIKSVALNFVFVGIAVFIAGSFQVACWTITASRQAKRIRSEYVSAIMTKEIGWFDVNEPMQLAKYESALGLSTQAGIKKGLAVGWGTGLMFGTVFCTYAAQNRVAIEEKEEGTSDVMTVEDLESPDDHNVRSGRSTRRSISRHSVSEKEGAAPIDDLELGDANLPPFSMARVWKMSLPEWKFLVAGSLGAMINAAVFPVWGVILVKVTVLFFRLDYTKSEMLDHARWWSLGFVGLGITFALSMTMQHYGFAVVSQKLVTRVRLSTFNAMLHQEIGWFDLDENSSGALVSRLATDSAVLQAMTSETLNRGLVNITTLTIAFAIAFFYSWQMTLILLAAFPVLVLSSYVQAQQMAGTSGNKKNNDADTAAGSLLSEAIGSIRTVASFSMEVALNSLYVGYLSVSKEADIKIGIVGGMAFGVSQGAMFLVLAFLFFVSGRWISRGIITFEEFFMVLMVIMLSTFAMGMAAQGASDGAKARRSAQRVFKVIDRKPLIDATSGTGRSLDHSGTLRRTGGERDTAATRRPQNARASMERLARQVQETQKLLQQPDLDWKDASAAIEELATAVETLGHADSYKDAVRLLVGVSRDIGMQVISIRSRLVKDVCEHLLRIVKVTGRDFQDLANALLPQIVHTAKNSSAAVRQPGAKLLCKVSELVRYDVSLMRKIFAQLTQDKVHVLLLEQLRVIFVYWSDDEVMAWESDVLEMIRQGLDDQNVNVRKTAREVLTTFSSRWSERVDELVDMPTTQSKALLVSEHPDSPLAMAILKKFPELANKTDVLSRSRRSSFMDKRSSFRKSPRHKREHNIEIHVSATPPPTQRDQKETMAQDTSSNDLYTHTETTVATPSSTRGDETAVPRQLFVDSTVSNFDDENQDIPGTFDGSQMHGYLSKSTSNSGTAATPPLESKVGEISSISAVVSSRLTAAGSGGASGVGEVSLPHPNIKKLQESKIPSPLNRSPSLLGRKRLDSPSRASSSSELRPSLLPRSDSFSLKARESNGPSTPVSAANMDEEKVELKTFSGSTGPFTDASAANVEEDHMESKPLSASDEFFSKPIPSTMATPTPPPSTDNVTLRPRRRTFIRHEREDLSPQAYAPELSSPELPAADNLTQIWQAEIAPESMVPSNSFDPEASPPLSGNRYAGYTSDEVDDLGHLTDGSDRVESDSEWNHRQLDDSRSQSGESDNVPEDNIDQLEKSGEHSFLDEWRLDEGPRHKFGCADETGDHFSDDQTHDAAGVEDEHPIATNGPQVLEVDWYERAKQPPEEHLAMSSDSENESSKKDSIAEAKPNSPPKDAVEGLQNVRDEMTRLRAITRKEEDSYHLSVKDRFASKPLPLDFPSTAGESHKIDEQIWEEPKRAQSSYFERLMHADRFEREASPIYAPHEQPEEINFLGQRESHGGLTSSQIFEQDLYLAANADTTEELEEHNFFRGLQNRSSSRPQMVEQASPKFDELKPGPFDFDNEPHPAKACSRPPEEYTENQKEISQDHKLFLDHGQAGRFDAAEKLFAANEPISPHGYYDRPQSPEPGSYMHSEPYQARAPPTSMGAKLNPAFANAQKNVVAKAASGNDEVEDTPKLRLDQDVKEVSPKHSQPVPSFVETVEMSTPGNGMPAASSVIPENAARPSPEPLSTVSERRAPPAKLGWAGSVGITVIVFLAAMFCMAGIMRAAKKVHDSHEYHLALKSRIDMFEASITESHEKVLRLEEDYAIWSEYVRKLTEDDEVNALTQLEAIQLEVQKWQQEMKADLVEFRQALSVESIEAGFATLRVNNTPQIEN
ncbi:hypothetical protein PRIC2_007860 [Phytophthora ramorum]